MKKFVAAFITTFSLSACGVSIGEVKTEIDNNISVGMPKEAAMEKLSGLGYQCHNNSIAVSQPNSPQFGADRYPIECDRMANSFMYSCIEFVYFRFSQANNLAAYQVSSPACVAPFG